MSLSSFKAIEKLEQEHYLQVFARYPIFIERGEGCYVWDIAGKKYLDFIGALATCSIGHGNRAVVHAITEQAQKLIGASNLYYTQPQLLLAKKLAELSGLQKCFLSNSGSEANETAIKIARKYTKKSEIICAVHGFHGRTMGALSATWKAKFKDPFKPLLDTFIFVEHGNAAAIEKAITSKTAAVMLEPIQGESGVLVPQQGYLKKVRALCDTHHLLLMLDEVQTGVGRTGKFFAYEHEKILPDITTLAKGIANGVPLGITLVSEKVAACMEKGDHGCTFGGNNLSCAAALATIEYIEKHNLIQNAEKTGAYFLTELRKLKHKEIKEVRGKGFMIAIEFSRNCKDIAMKCHHEGLLCAQTSDVNLRFLPPLIATKKEVDEACSMLKRVLSIS